MDDFISCFSDDRLIASGERAVVLAAAKAHLEARPEDQLLFFKNRSGRQADFDLQAPLDKLLEDARAQAPVASGPGRPRLGVVAREVTLLPRHWEWLADQPSGASAALRRLVDEARRNETPKDRARRTAAAVGRMMTALAGNRPGFEEAYRALDAGDLERFGRHTKDWPQDVRGFLLEQAEPAFVSSE